MYGQPIIIKQQAPARRRSYSKRPSRTYKKYKKAFYAARNFRYKKQLALGPRGSEPSVNYWGKDYATATDDQKLMRRAVGFRGKGDYLTDIGKWGSRAIGMGLGGYLGGARGAAQGHQLGARFSRWVGWGDYAGDAGGNQIMSGSTDVPITVNEATDLTGDIYLSHREFLGNIQATGGSGNISPFSVVSYAINPGLTASFPWLSQIAQNFELYELEGLIYEYKPTSGEFGATGTNSLGKIVMATNYDPDALPFTSTVQMENYDYSNACKPSEHMLHGVETAAKQRVTNMLYVRSMVSSKDKVFTDVGNFQIASEGLPITSGVTANIGELWVTYRVKLSRAQLYGSLINQSCMCDFFQSSTHSASPGQKLFDGTVAFVQSQTWGPSYSLNFLGANQMAPKLSNTLGATVTSTSASALTITFPPNIVQGYFAIVINAYGIPYTGLTWGAGATSLQYCTVVTSNGTNYGAVGNALAVPSTATNSTPNGLSALAFISVNAPGNAQASLKFTLSGFPASDFQMQLLITSVPQGMLSA
jgi:hypothetical protein